MSLYSKFNNSKWRIQDSGLNCQKLLDLAKILDAGVIEVTDYESDFKIHKFSMADPTWLSKIQNVT